MRTSDKTLLSKLGFDDQDKRNPLHTQACQYLSLPEQAGRIAAMEARVLPSGLGPIWDVADPSDRYRWDQVDETKWLAKAAENRERRNGLRIDLGRQVSASVETPLTKGSYQYLSVVGFIDVDVKWSDSYVASGTKWRHGSVDGEPYRIEDTYNSGRIFIEVKAGECDVNDLIRQVRCYKSFVGESCLERNVRWMAALCFRPLVTFKQALDAAGIHMLTLGPKFREWVEANKTQRVEPNDAESM